MTYNQFFKNHLEQLKQEGRYRVFIDLERPFGKAPHALWHKNASQKEEVEDVIVWCSNDYLGMSHHPEVVTALCYGAQLYGAGSGGTRNISGTAHPHVLLEQDIAAFHQKEAGLIFSSGYVANEATISALASHLPDCAIFSDDKNHASMIQGIRNSRAEKYIFRHNDMKDLEEHLASVPRTQPKLIVFTSVYSMDGDIAPIKEICALAKKYGALTYVDEVHAVGMYGETGAGVSEFLGIQNELDIIQGNFAKGFGVVGGYITGSSTLIDFIRSTASGFIFTTSMPPAIAMAARASLKVIQRDQDLRARFWDNVDYFKDAIQKSPLMMENMVHSYCWEDEIEESGLRSHIVPVVIGNAGLCKKICDHLLNEYRIYIQPINYPTVPVGQERLRITITPDHTFQDIDYLLSSLSAVCRLLGNERVAA